VLHLRGLEHISFLWIAGSIVQIYLVSALIDSFICAAIDTTIDTFIKHYLANSTCQADWLCPNILEISSNSGSNRPASPGLLQASVSICTTIDKQWQTTSNLIPMGTARKT